MFDHGFNSVSHSGSNLISIVFVNFYTLHTSLFLDVDLHSRCMNVLILLYSATCDHGTNLHATNLKGLVSSFLDMEWSS